MLLIDIRVDMPPSHTAALDAWYGPHLLHVCAMPGVLSGRRYRAADPERSGQVIALYEVRSREDAVEVLSDDVSSRDPVLIEDWDLWIDTLVPHMRAVQN